MLMEIPFTHETGGVFTESIGMPGLDHSSFGSLMPRAAKSIELLRQRKASGELPLLSLPARRDDINAWQPIIDRQSVVTGKRVSVRVHLCGHRFIKKKNQQLT